MRSARGLPSWWQGQWGEVIRDDEQASGGDVTAPPLPRPPADPGGTAADEHRRHIVALFLDEAAAGRLDLPLPGRGDTWRRWSALRDLAHRDLSLARLAEGHADALAIMAELGAAPPQHGSAWGVWAAHPPGPDLHARFDRGHWRLSGVKRFCSGADVCTHGLVSAVVDGGDRRLFAVRADAAAARPGTWAAAGMAASATLTLAFADVAAEPVGPPGAYTDRPGFHHGGIGVAACWYGGALAVARPLAARVRGGADPHAQAHYGAVDRDLHAADAVLRAAAEEVDADPRDTGGGAAVRAMRTRAVLAEACADVLRHAGEALGAGPLAGDPRYARAAEDLAVYIRQHHGARDLAGLGAHTAHREDDTVAEDR
ncbi:alkylation response protein AidB-like acyl-CoA dehydrogenase [Murinocardiopsis flavida]|uniref:Alkylation response protein AidB-like acyl-CoA dehydrogenase n=1 Tax=Murinocardiopsis flavida TaxID=645275 RepID=A0A2P8CRA8_9ACTN|nr:alkylation response protein AidB-like acyl-CoA dehydrogenase [Murinocardiopsis flavida]